MKLSLRSFVNRNIRNLFIVFVIMLFVTGTYIISIIPSIINNTFAPYELDYEKAFEPKYLMVISGNINKNQPYIETEIQEKIDVGAQKAFDYTNVFKQNNKYKFKIKPVEVYDLGLYYETSYSISANGINSPYVNSEVTHKYVLLDTGKAVVLTKVAPDFDIDKHQSYIGVFLPFPSMLEQDIRKNLDEGIELNNVFGYVLDTTTSFSSYELLDIGYLSVLLIIVIVIGIKLIIYKVDYRKHPTYKHLYKLYGEHSQNEISLDADLSEAANVVVTKNTYETENWIVTRGIFKTKFSMVKKASRFD